VEQAESALEEAQARLAEARQAPQQHQSLLAQQRAALDAARHDLVAARLMATRKERLVQGKLLAPEEGEAARELVNKLQAAERAEQEKLHALELRDPAQDVARAEANVRAKKALLKRARHALRECTLKAPVDGTVLRVPAGRGEVLGPQRRQPAVYFCPAGPRIIRAEVEPEYARRVAVGQGAVVREDAGNGPTWQGNVIRIADWYTPRRTLWPERLPFQDPRTLVLEYIIRLDPPQPPLRISQRVRVNLLSQ